MIHVYRVIRNP